MTSAIPRDIVADYQSTLQDAFGAIAILAAAIDDLAAENQDLRQRLDDVEQDLIAARAAS